jgi:hypothetical protein
VTGGPAKDDCQSLSKADAPVERGFVLSLVKLTGSGLVLLTFPRENPCHRRRRIKYFPMSGIWDFKVTSVSCWRYWFLFLKLSYLSKHGSVFH